MQKNSEPLDCRQVIVIRKDLKMRRGKEIAQACHGSIAFISLRFRSLLRFNPFPMLRLCFNRNIREWILGSFTKITLQVNSEEELLKIHQMALDAGLESHLITDSGRTEFDGVPTNTCCCIGPAPKSSFGGITDHLSMY